jgi:hypothetical protein
MFLCAAALMGALGAGCSNNSNESEQSDEQSQNPNDKPQDSEQSGESRAFSEYSFTRGEDGEFSARWVNLDNVGWSDKRLVVINNDNELRQYVEGDYPAVDFSTKTLLLAYGGDIEYGHVFRADKQDFRQISESNYVMTVNVPLSIATAMGGWLVAIVVDKLDENSEVELVVTNK